MHWICSVHRTAALHANRWQKEKKNETENNERLLNRVFRSSLSNSCCFLWDIISWCAKIRNFEFSIFFFSFIVSKLIAISVDLSTRRVFFEISQKNIAPHGLRNYHRDKNIYASHRIVDATQKFKPDSSYSAFMQLRIVDEREKHCNDADKIDIIAASFKNVHTHTRAACYFRKSVFFNVQLTLFFLSYFYWPLYETSGNAWML